MLITNFFQEAKDFKCLGIQCVRKQNELSNFCFFKAKTCNGTIPRHYVMPLCQFPVDTECYRNSDLALIQQNEKDELFKIKETKTRIYFGAQKQVK